MYRWATLADIHMSNNYTLNAPRHDHVHLWDLAWLTVARVYLHLLSSPLVHSQPLKQISCKLPQSCLIFGLRHSQLHSSLHGMTNNQFTSTELLTIIGPEYEPVKELTHQMLQPAAETCPSWSAEELYQHALMKSGANDQAGALTCACGSSNLQLAGLSHSNSQQSLSHSPLLTPSNSLGLKISYRQQRLSNSHQTPSNTPLLTSSNSMGVIIGIMNKKQFPMQVVIVWPNALKSDVDRTALPKLFIVVPAYLNLCYIVATDIHQPFLPARRAGSLSFAHCRWAENGIR